MFLMNTIPFSDRLRRWPVWLLAICPCLTAWGFHWSGANPSPCAPAKVRPALAFDQYAVNLGPVEPMGLVNGRFRFTNQSGHPVKVTSLRPSCGCLQPRLEKRDYAPGDTGEFDVNVATAGEMPGPREYTITMDYEDPNPQSVNLTFRLELPERQIYINPRAVLVYQFGDEPVTRDIVVMDNRQSPATVTAIESREKFVSAVLAGTEINQDAVQSTTIKVTIAGVSAGNHGTTLKIHTDDPQFPVLNVPVRVQRQPPISPGPKSSALGAP
jgi:hypothetical protein